MISGEKVKPKLVRNDQGMPGWNVYIPGGRFKKVTFYPEADTFYFEVEADE